MSFTFSEDTHTYRLAGGRIAPGHTRVLDLGGLIDYSFVEPDILERKSLLGREVHNATLLYDQGKKLKVDPRVEPYLEAWIALRKATKFKPLMHLREYRSVYSHDGLPFGMQNDAIGEFEDRETCVELKICTEIFPHVGVQLAAQAAFIEHPKIKSPLALFRLRGRVAAQLKPDARFKIHRFTDLSDFPAYTSCLYLAHWKMQYEKHYKGENNEHHTAV